MSKIGTEVHNINLQFRELYYEMYEQIKFYDISFASLVSVIV